MNLNDAHYEKFTTRERLGLLYEALARRDYSEADRLADTCGRKNYKMPDAAYLQNLQYIHMACLQALLAISEAEARAGTAGVAMLLAKERDANPTGDVLPVYTKAMSEIVGIWEAWQAFCARAGVNPKAVILGCWGRVPRIVEELYAPDSGMAKTIKADSETQAGMLDLFMRQWDTIQDQLAA